VPPYMGLDESCQVCAMIPQILTLTLVSQPNVVEI